MVVLCDPKYIRNLAEAKRACAAFGENDLRWTGGRIRPDLAFRVKRLPRELRMYKEVTVSRLEGPTSVHGLTPVAVEFGIGEPLDTFEHPENAMYVFGPEDGNVPKAWLSRCHRFVHIPADYCLNLSHAVSIVLNDRRMKELS